MKNLLRCLLSLVFTVLLFSGLSAQSQWKLKQITAKRTKSHIKIDGFLDEAEWNEASKAADFIQLEPEKGSLSRKKGALLQRRPLSVSCSTAGQFILDSGVLTQNPKRLRPG